MTVDQFIQYLIDLSANHGKIYCLNFLTKSQGLSLPDAVMFYDVFVRNP